MGPTLVLSMIYNTLIILSVLDSMHNASIPFGKSFDNKGDALY